MFDPGEFCRGRGGDQPTFGMRWDICGSPFLRKMSSYTVNDFDWFESR